MKIPGEILALFEQESEGLTHGLVRLELFLRDGHSRFVLAKERSIIPADEQSTDIPITNIEKKSGSLSIAPTERKDSKK
jgi:hypothetical protein